jgi:hypothetical protein
VLRHEDEEARAPQQKLIILITNYSIFFPTMQIFILESSFKPTLNNEIYFCHLIRAREKMDTVAKVNPLKNSSKNK